MKRLLISALVLVAGCQSYPSANSINWTDLETDIALHHRYEQYSCANRSLHGYSKDSWTYAAPSHHQHHEPEREPLATSVRQATDSAEGRQALDQVRELSAKIDILEDALKTNAGATNQNQALIVEQIKSLKAELAKLKSANGAAASTQSPRPPANTVSGIRFGTN
jgi:hypothetical protein